MDDPILSLSLSRAPVSRVLFVREVRVLHYNSKERVHSFTLPSLQFRGM